MIYYLALLLLDGRSAVPAEPWTLTIVVENDRGVHMRQAQFPDRDSCYGAFAAVISSQPTNGRPVYIECDRRPFTI